eukprot:3940393-Alexandrium_andersonii.AAC.1
MNTTQADHQDTAADIVRRYAAAVAAGQPTHRVSDILAGTGAGSLRRVLVAFAGAGNMSEALRALITSYQLALLDDAVAEGPHAR